MRVEDFVKRAEQVLAIASKTQATVTTNRSELVVWTHVDQSLFSELRGAALSFTETVFGAEHSYHKAIQSVHALASVPGLQQIQGTVTAARDELKGGWFVTVRELLTAEVFADFLEMAEHLLSLHYKDPAAVLVGCVLEERLRHLCTKNGIDIEVPGKAGKMTAKKAEMMNQDLAGATVYNKLEQKNVTAWLGLRNDAAHGKHSEYVEKQVIDMLSAVQGFLIRYPA
jgi:hypothetical protein